MVLLGRSFRWTQKSKMSKLSPKALLSFVGGSQFPRVILYRNEIRLQNQSDEPGELVRDFCFNKFQQNQVL